MHTKVTATVVARTLSDLLNRVRYRGETFTIVRGGEAVCQMTPIGARPRMTLGALREALAALPRPDDAFRSDLERIRAEQPPAESSWPT